MSAIPSLSVWSSIKIPTLVYSGRSWNQTKSSVPYIDSYKKVNQTRESNSKTTREVVNLRVPTPLGNEKDNSFPDITCTCGVVRKKRGSQKRSQNINRLSVPVPSTPTFDEIYTRDSVDYSLSDHKPNCDFQDYNEWCRSLLFDDSFPESDDGMEIDCIPSVKPWTEEELQLLNMKFHLVEEKGKGATDKKKKNKRRVKISKSDQTPRTPNKSSCLLPYKSRKSFSQNFYDDTKPQDSFALEKLAGGNYYETKLAELYMIELGIKR